MIMEDSVHTKRPRRFMAPSTARAAATAALVIALGMVAWPAAFGVLSPAAAQQTQDGERPFGFIDRLFGGSERIGGADRAAPQPPSGAPVVAGERSAQMSGSDLLLRLDRLEAQVRQLTGTIEQLQYRNQQLEGLVRRMQEDGEARLQEPGARSRPLGQPRPPAMSQAAPMSSASPQSVPAASPARRGDAFDPAQNPNAPGAPQALGSIPAGTVANAGDASIGAGRAAPAAGPGAVAALPPSASPRDEFDLAYGYVLRRDFVLAETGFRRFLEKHPNDQLAGEATFWYGESLYQRQRFRDAAEAFLNVSTKFESNAKAPDALLRLGQSLAALGEKEAACASLGEVGRKFPRAAASVKQGVEREQKRVRC
jgi:tol-pal system protein YbgF